MNWTKLLYIGIIILLYIPMVFVGSNVFFPKYTGANAYYQGQFGNDCYAKYPYPAEGKGTDTERGAISEKQQQCQIENQKAQQQFDQDKLAYEGPKYVFIALFNLIILMVALFLPKLQDSVSMGLFIGSIATTFGATIRYFDTNSKLGFGVLVVTFFAMLFFINRKKDSFVDWKGK